MDCLFCGILEGKIPSTKVFDNGRVYAFLDIHPQAPVHILVIHREHTASLSETPDDKSFIFSDIFSAVRQIAEQEHLNEKGYRVVFNNGRAAGQMVFHVHAHILAGKESLGGLLP
jgi:histidine triad (HIT) family protein